MSETHPTDVNQRLWRHFSVVSKVFATLSKVREAPETVYHYTTAEGLLGILSSRTIWASNVQFLNDSSETTYARTITAAALNRLGNEVPPFVLDAFNDRRSPDIEEDVQLFHRVVREAPYRHSYIASFSLSSDILSQWRAYAGRGGGFAIGFSTKPFLDHPYDKAKITGAVVIPLPVLYNVSEQAESVSNLARAVPQVIKHLPELELEEHELWKYTILTLAFNMMRLKNPGFSEEKEWRLLVSGSRGVRFRVSNGRFVPFLEQQFKPDDVTVIVQGPTANTRNLEESLRHLLNETGFAHVRIERSAIPLV